MKETVRLAAWQGGMGLRCGAPGVDPAWVARASRPLLLLRKDGQEIREETFSFDTVSARDDDLEADASFVDGANTHWEVRLQAHRSADHGFSGTLRWTLRSGAASGVFAGHRLGVLADPADLYVCFPGSVYDGNDFTKRQRDIPRVSRTGVLEMPTTSLAAPCAAFHARSSGASLVLATTQRAATADGRGASTGLLYDARCLSRPTIAVTAPLYRTAWYHLENRDGDFRFHFVPRTEPGATLAPGQWIELPLGWFCGMDSSLAEFFRRLHDLRPFFRAGHRRVRSLPLSEAASLVAHNQDRFHWQEEGFYANATEVNGANATQLLSGWCSGIMTGYGLLKSPDPLTRQRAIRMIDLTCETGLSPSGLFYGLRQDGRWVSGDPAEGDDATPWRHIRTAEDGTFYLLRANAFERRRGTDHPSWLAAARRNLDAFLHLWERHGEFGHEIDRRTGEMVSGGSAAGALCIACLAEGSSATGERRYLEAARDAADSYHARFTATGRTNGGPLDILMAADSESCLMFPEAFMAVYAKTTEPRFLRFAVEAADQLASWVLAFDGVFPPGTTLGRLGIQTIGGVVANAQNHHIGPGGATSSLSSLLAIYRASGEERFLRLLEDVVTGLPQYLSRSDGGIDRLAKGMMSEQINLADAMNHAQGEIWNISASWGATNILLAWLELPGVYADPGRRTIAVFDHLEAAPDWARGTVEIRNPTGFDAASTLEVEGMPRHELQLGPGERITLPLG